MEFGLDRILGREESTATTKAMARFRVGTVLEEKRVSPLRSSQTANCCGRNDRFWVGERTGNGNDRSRSPAGMTSKKSKCNGKDNSNGNNKIGRAHV